MFILAQVSGLENSKDNILRVSDNGRGEEYLADGYKQQERVYKLKYQHKEYSIVCPEFRNDKDGVEPVIFIPEFLIPRRPFPVEVYLYAIDLYSRDPKIGQRKVAETTRQRFGLSTFSHTTLGRALKRFAQVMEGSAIKVPDNDTEQKEDAKQFVFPNRLMTQPWCEIASHHLRGRASSECQRQASDFCRTLVRKWFAKTRRFLL